MGEIPHGAFLNKTKKNCFYAIPFCLHPKLWKPVHSPLRLHGDTLNASPDTVFESDAKKELGWDQKTEHAYDNGDVGSGDKLLYLLQKWDIRNAVLAVTRIDGGFAQAEILGIRRCVGDYISSTWPSICVQSSLNFTTSSQDKPGSQKDADIK